MGANKKGGAADAERRGTGVSATLAIFKGAEKE